MAIPGRRARCLFPPDRRAGRWPPHALKPRGRRAPHGARAPAPGPRAHSPLRRGRPGRIQAVVATLDIEEVAMGRPKGWAASQTGRPVERSPGRPPAGRREHRVRFWSAIRRGVSTVEAAVEAGVSEAVGVRWFREGGGMPCVTVAPLSGPYLSFAEREEIALLRAEKLGVREIARRIGRSPSTISRELRRNAGTRSGSLTYRASTAQWHADRRGGRPKPAKLATNPELRRYVQDRLSGAVQRPDGCAVAGPEVRWIGRRHGPRKDRRWGSPGARSRSPIGCAWTSRMMSR